MDPGDFKSLCFDYITNITRNMTTSDKHSLFVLGVVNSVLAVPTAAANALVIVAILTTSSLRTPSYVLVTSLAFSDLAVGILGQPVFSATIFLYINEYVKAYCYLSAVAVALSAVFYGAVLFTLAAISVDRYLAIRLKMRYKTSVTLRRARCCVVLIWIYSFSSITFPYIMPWTAFWVYAAVVITILLFVMLYCYTMSFRALKIHSAQTQPQHDQQPNSTTQSNAIDVLKYRKLLNTMLLIVALLVICSLPLLVVSILFSQSNFNRVVAWYLISVAGLNSLFNPVIYMTRMNDLRYVCLRLFRRMLRMGDE